MIRGGGVLISQNLCTGNIEKEKKKTQKQVFMKYI